MKLIPEFDEVFFRAKEGEVYKIVIEAIEKPLIESILARVDGNQLKAAKILGVNRNTLHAKIKRLGIRVQRWRN